MTRPISRPASKAMRFFDAGHPKADGVQRVRGGRGSPFAVLLLLLIAGVQLSLQQGDPVSNFCRRFGHQAAIVDERLYIDGGYLNYNPLEQFPTNYTNDYLFFHDLSSVAKSGMPQLEASLTKNRTIPSLHGGVLWPDGVNKRLYQFGGEFPASDRATPLRGLYAYDILYDTWDYHPIDHAGQPESTVVRRTSYGAGAAVQERGEGYWYGGWVSNRSEPDWGAGDNVVTSNLVKYDMDRDLWTNSSGPDGVGRAEGAMVYLPAGDAGMLVYMGGVRDVSGNGSAVEGQPMDEVFVYDVLSSKWYVQKASGDVPEMRGLFCAGVAWADDRSSYNIYIYGGASMPPSTIGFDDLYILSLPTFTWTKLYPESNGTGEYPHHSLTCTVTTSLSQMLVIGGWFPATDMCDTPEQWGVHNVDLGRQNPDGAIWALYEPEKKGYVVPKNIIDVIGGGGSGGATKAAPEGGFVSPDLKVLLSRTASSPKREPTRDVSGGETGGGLSKGAIAGIAVGGVAVLLALVLGAVICLRRRRRQRRVGPPQDSPGPETAFTARDYLHPVPVPQAGPIELAAEQPGALSGYSYTLSPVSDHSKDQWARELSQAGSPIGVAEERERAAHELSSTPGVGGSTVGEGRVHATYYHA
ncbi:uncharacterized protein DNG_01545 [Cephalotrichum gorgonifer]|uniref:Uncharacterized protein n=1 Tax=Cephalotrichum gorgonifer TaxID=2041049 RepID=A0AAE8MQR1_9PEZI|nr:uncharacterized protein DNG_01545 [Cephalotrichum gorgonifer]